MVQVALIHRSFGQGGLEKTTRGLIHAFQKAGCTVTLLSCEADLDLCNVICFSKRSAASFDEAVIKFLKEQRFDLTFAADRCCVNQTHLRAGFGVHRYYVNQLGWKKHPSFFWNKKHKDLITYEKKMFTNPCLKKIFVNSVFVKNQLLDVFKLDPQKIDVVYNGVELDTFTPLQKKKSSPFHFLFVGHGFKRKGLAYVLQGLKYLRDQEFTLTVVGKDKQQHQYASLARKLGLEQKVTFAGAQNDARAYYHLADALVIPTLYDPCANVTFEAWASGLFVISSKYNGAVEWLDDTNGVIIEHLKDPLSVAKSLEHALTQKKTPSDIFKRRKAIEALDFSRQMDKIVAASCEGLL